MPALNLSIIVRKNRFARKDAARNIAVYEECPRTGDRIIRRPAFYQAPADAGRSFLETAFLRVAGARERIVLITCGPIRRCRANFGILLLSLSFLLESFDGGSYDRRGRGGGRRTDTRSCDIRTHTSPFLPPTSSTRIRTHVSSEDKTDPVRRDVLRTSSVLRAEFREDRSSPHRFRGISRRSSPRRPYGKPAGRAECRGPRALPVSLPTQQSTLFAAISR